MFLTQVLKILESALKSYQEALNNANIDVQLLGVGSNGHIGFNEPGTSFDTGVPYC